MKSMFVAMPFGRFDLGSYVPSPIPEMGASGSASDLLDVSKDIESLLKEVPPEAMGAYQAEYKHCQDLLDKGGLIGLTTGGKCLYDLYEKLKNEIKNPKPTSPIPYLAPQSSFPVVPVVLLVVGGAALVFGLSKLG